MPRPNLYLHWGFPESVSTTGGQIDRLFWIMMAFTVPILVAIVIFVAYCLLRFRRSKSPQAAYLPGFKTAWGTGLLAGALFLAELPMDFFQEKVWTQATAHFPKPAESVVIQVFAEQFAWNFRYAGTDGQFGTPDDITTVNNLRVPIGKPVICLMRSRDVLHSFFLPHFRVKLDVMPGVTRRVWFQATTIGRYEVACAELCGLGHYRMRGIVHVLSPEDFKGWLKEESEYLKEEGPGIEVKKWTLWSDKP